MTPYCPDYHRTVEVIGGRWTPEIVRALLTGIRRFSAIAAAIPGLSDRTLSQRLKLLEAEGLVRREVTDATPVRVEYHLTEKGEGLAETVRAIASWAERWRPSASRSRSRYEPARASTPASSSSRTTSAE